jgi:hypothetical protein
VRSAPRCISLITTIIFLSNPPLLKGFIPVSDVPTGLELLQALSVNKKDSTKITQVILDIDFIFSF